MRVRFGSQTLNLGMILAFVLQCSIFSNVAEAAKPAVDLPLFAELSYADTADLALRADIVATIQVATAKRLKGELAPDLPAGSARFLVEADVQSLLRGSGGLAGHVSYIVDVPLDSRGKAPNLKKRRFIVLAATVPGRPQEIRLISLRGQVDWSAAAESRIRAILTEASGPGAPATPGGACGGRVTSRECLFGTGWRVRG